jgi:hypothetical protein
MSFNNLTLTTQALMIIDEVIRSRLHRRNYKRVPSPKPLHLRKSPYPFPADLSRFSSFIDRHSARHSAAEVPCLKYS